MSDDLATSIVELIDDGGHRAGDRLESVRELADRFGVAVPTVREALRRLEATGSVELRHGSGVYVGDNLGRWVLTNPVVPAPTTDRLLNLLEARLVLEPTVAGLAAEHRDEADLDRLQAVLDAALRAIDLGDADAIAHHNMQFHRQIAQACGNPMLAELVESITSVNVRAHVEILRIHGDQLADHGEHVAIRAAILGQRRRLAERRTREHISAVLDVVRDGAARERPTTSAGRSVGRSRRAPTSRTGRS